MSSVWEWFADWPTGALVFVDVVASGTTALAAGFAAYAIRQAKEQARAAQAALLHERVVDHRLDLLKELAEENEKPSNVAFVDASIKIRARMLPIDLVPLTRAAMGLESTDDAVQEVREGRLEGNTARMSMRQAIADELVAAIEATLSSTPEGSSRYQAGSDAGE